MKHPNDQVILAIDPGTQRVGWCAGQGGRYIASESLEIPGADPWVRLCGFTGAVQGLVLTFDPDCIACELSMRDRGNRHVDRVLGAAVGVVVAVGAVNGVPFLPINSATLRATGFHKDAPGMVARLVDEDVSIDQLAKDPDRCDAVGVWQAALSVLQRDALMQRVEREEAQWTLQT